MAALTGLDVTISTGGLLAFIVVYAVELVLAVYCIVDIVRRPAVAGGNKWVWVVIVLVFSLIGPIVYLVVGRAQAPVAEERGSSN